MIVAIIVLGYLALLVLMCLFFKGATRLANEYDEKMEAERIIKMLEKE